jgi:HPt (histidine-containing phosphotransfer) domain-containing protein
VAAVPTTATAAAAPAGGWWDRDEALRLVGGNPTLLDNVLPVFIQQLRKLSVQLRAPGDTDVAPLFHTLKGMAGTLGAGELCRRAAAAESAAKLAGDGDGALAANVCEAIEGTLAELDPAG